MRERLFLAFGLGSALILVLAAFAGGGDPESAGRAELVSTAARIADAVQAEWKDLSVREDWNASTSIGESRCYALVESRFSLGAPLPPVVPGTELVYDPGSGHEVFDALFAQSEQVELAKADPAGALELVLEALQKTNDPARHADARLRAVQLAAKAQKSDAAREQYQLACAELDGTQRKGRVSYRILLALSLAPALDDAGRKQLGDELDELYKSKRLGWDLPAAALTLPASSLDATRFVEDPSVVSMLALLRELSSSFAPRFEDTRSSQALSNDLGAISANDTPQLELKRTRAGFFGCWSTHPPAQYGGFISDEKIARTFREALDRSGVVPGGFIVDVDPPQSHAILTRGHDTLDGDFGFTVKHEDPEGWIRRSAAKQKFLRVALLVLALLSAAAGVATFRALRRERTLAELKTDFVANVSHELRTPLASILLLSENLESGRVTKPEDAARYHGLIRREALRLRRLVDDVLDFSRLERGKRLEVHREALRLDPWLEHIFDELGAWAREHGLELELARSPTDSDAEIDGEALRRALLNLLDNARKHSGEAKVELSALRAERELVLRVRDHGRGILPADRGRVFEPFTRLDGGEAPGAGLGLSIVREIARAHGGSVRALDPEGGPGIVFEMRIPLAEEPAA